MIIIVYQRKHLVTTISKVSSNPSPSQVEKECRVTITLENLSSADSRLGSHVQRYGWEPQRRKWVLVEKLSASDLEWVAANSVCSQIRWRRIKNRSTCIASVAAVKTKHAIYWNFIYPWWAESNCTFLACPEDSDKQTCQKLLEGFFIHKRHANNIVDIKGVSTPIAYFSVSFN